MTNTPLGQTVAPSELVGGVGNKADGLRELAQRYPGLVPEFIILPISEIVIDWSTHRARAEAAITTYLSGESSTAEFEQWSDNNKAAVQTDSTVIAKMLDRAGASEWGSVSVRTSALAEDGADSSFAGQYRTALNCPADPDRIEAEIRACLGELTSIGIVSYAKSRGLTSLEVGGSIVVQRMFHGSRTGVLLSESGRGEITLAWSEGSRNTTVDGENAQHLLVSKLTEWPRRLPAPAALLDIALDCERWLGHPVDIEWAAKGNTLALLQVRPQTTLQLDYDLAWDCSNIAENYPGITLPLTYSFIRGLYSRVYPAFFRLIGVSRAALEEKQSVFRNTLGYLGGRVYYQIDNWYEMIKLLPGPNRNQDFFQAMLQPSRTPGVETQKKLGFAGGLAMAPLIARMGWLLLRSNSMSERFKRQFGLKLRRYEALDWTRLQADAILVEIERMRSELLTMWAVPVFNDLRVMIFHGLLKTYCFTPEQHADYLGYLHGLSDRASIAPLSALGQLGNELRSLTRPTVSVQEVLDSPKWPQLKGLVDEYLDRFGGRAPDELQLENPRLGDDYSVIVSLALGTDPAGKPARDAGPRVARGRFGTAWTGKHTRQAIDWRERFRFNRAQVYGLARTAYSALGERLVQANVLDTASDVFWVTEDELDQTVYGHGWDRDLRGVVARRKAEFAEYESATLARRMVGFGLIAPRSLLADDQRSGDGMAKGMGVSPGVLTAEVIVVGEFDPTIDVRGKILVTSHIDPGWTLLFVQAAGVVTERGNALSHVSIISRELGMPAVVAAMGATEVLRTGQIITINGTTGDIDEAA
ncbi:hypothetical protein G7066_02465 [Leucobacter coleopterorum]|uniref:Pyruvate, water dikinase n=1 Tax=Leucobacter coleopterorum TaxID=2714933 RepID=A0ABX6JY16_9MICO|nr:PEP/pyruvate-binding domain-containing protein [Leucobacter coleopterorum]QIM17839.1 hypothetical protein G7066_02465 [Leucobacter coleopterorum]